MYALPFLFDSLGLRRPHKMVKCQRTSLKLDEKVIRTVSKRKTYVPSLKYEEQSNSQPELKIILKMN